MTPNPHGTLQQSQYASANLIWLPDLGLDVGLEYLFGWRKVTENTAINGKRTGFDHRLMITVRWSFSGQRTFSEHQPFKSDPRESPRCY